MEKLCNHFEKITTISKKKIPCVYKIGMISQFFSISRGSPNIYDKNHSAIVFEEKKL